MRGPSRRANLYFPDEALVPPSPSGPGGPLWSAILSVLPEHLLLGPVLLAVGRGGWEAESRFPVGSLEEEDEISHFTEFSSRVEASYPRSHLGSRAFLFLLPSLLFFASRPAVFPACAAAASARTGLDMFLPLPLPPSWRPAKQQKPPGVTGYFSRGHRAGPLLLSWGRAVSDPVSSSRLRWDRPGLRWTTGSALSCKPGERAASVGRNMVSASHPTAPSTGVSTASLMPPGPACWL